MTLQAAETKSPAPSSSPLAAFHWERQPQAEAFIRGVVDDFLARTPAAADLARRMRDETGTRFFDWVGEVGLPATPEWERKAKAAGYTERSPRRFVHEGGMFPPIHLVGESVTVAIKVESIVDFAAANDLPLITPHGPTRFLRQLFIAAGDGTSFWAEERHGCVHDRPPPRSEKRRVMAMRHLEKFRTRTRTRNFGGDDASGFALATRLVDKAINELGVDTACDLFFAAEREYWQRRNRAAQFQKARQDKLGLGWANHDHHTYRSSRRYFAALIGLFEKLGFHCRERFYAGREAGWGAQVLEQPNAGIVIFADVDLSPEELMNDFAHDPLPPRDKLGTVGLWCGLHGESFLEAGMHHLECQFDFDALRQQLEQQGGVKVMKPFTDFPYLRQAFTEGERWPVRESRITALLSQKLITEAQANQFRTQGAIGSHLENLERNEGFKGFNQTGVSEIIAATDPRKHLDQ